MASPSVATEPTLSVCALRRSRVNSQRADRRAATAPACGCACSRRRTSGTANSGWAKSWRNPRPAVAWPQSSTGLGRIRVQADLAGCPYQGLGKSTQVSRGSRLGEPAYPTVIQAVTTQACLSGPGTRLAASRGQEELSGTIPPLRPRSRHNRQKPAPQSYGSSLPPRRAIPVTQAPKTAELPKAQGRPVHRIARPRTRSLRGRGRHPT
jgi:hypothetical protein